MLTTQVRALEQERPKHPRPSGQFVLVKKTLFMHQKEEPHRSSRADTEAETVCIDRGAAARLRLPVTDSGLRPHSLQSCLTSGLWLLLLVFLSYEGSCAT